MSNIRKTNERASQNEGLSSETNEGAVADRRGLLFGGVAGLAGLGALALASAVPSRAAAQDAATGTDDVEEIRKLLVQYNLYLDAGDLKSWAALYRHGIWREKNEEDARKFLEGFILLYPSGKTAADGGTGTGHTAHCLLNEIITVNPDGMTASSTCYRVGFQSLIGIEGIEDFPIQPIFVLSYDDTFEKIDGKWWFKSTVLKGVIDGNTSRHVKG